MLLTDTSGKKSLTMTLTVVAFVIVVFKVLLSGVAIGSFSFGVLEPTTAIAVLTPVIAAYTARRLGDDTQKQ